MSVRERLLDGFYLFSRVEDPLTTARSSRRPGLVRWKLRAGGSFSMRGASSDMLAVREVILRNTLPLRANHFAVVVDIGAHVGSFTAKVSSRADRVIAFEPVKENHLILETLQSGGAEIEFHNQAVTKDGRSVTMHLHPTNTGRHSLHRQDESEGISEAPSISSSDVVGIAGGWIDLLKIDAEGAEHEILEDGVLMRASREMLIEMNEVEPGDVSRLRRQIEISGFDVRSTSPQVIHATRQDRKAHHWDSDLGGSRD